MTRVYIGGVNSTLVGNLTPVAFPVRFVWNFSHWQQGLTSSGVKYLSSTFKYLYLSRFF